MIGTPTRPGASHDIAFARRCRASQGWPSRCREMEGTLSSSSKPMPPRAGKSFRPTARRSIAGRADPRKWRRRKCAAAGRSDADLYPARRSGRLVEPAIAAEQGTGRGDVLPRPLVSICRLNVRAVIQAYDRSRRWAGRSSRLCRRCRNSGASSSPIRRAVSGSDRSRQRLRAVAQSGDLARHRNPAAALVSGHGGLSRQRQLDAADPGDLRGRPRRPGQGPLRRSGFSQADGNRGSDRGVEETQAARLTLFQVRVCSIATSPRRAAAASRRTRPRCARGRRRRRGGRCGACQPSTVRFRVSGIERCAADGDADIGLEQTIRSRSDETS